MEISYVIDASHSRVVSGLGEAALSNLRVVVPADFLTHSDRKLSVYRPGGMSTTALATWAVNACLSVPREPSIVFDIWDDHISTAREYKQADLDRLVADIQKINGDVVATLAVGALPSSHPDYYLWATIRGAAPQRQASAGEIGISLSVATILNGDSWPLLALALGKKGVYDVTFGVALRDAITLLLKKDL